MYFSFLFCFLNADSLCITLYVTCLYMKTHMYFVGVSTCVFVQSLDDLNKEFCSVLFIINASFQEYIRGASTRIKT